MLLRLLAFFLLALPFPGWAQIPEGHFSRPGTKVGEVFTYELRLDHAPELEVIFPDSLADFGTFEYVDKTYAPTRTRHGRSLDRARYRLRTFALDSAQTLALPVLVLRPHDTLTLRPTPARIRLIRTAPTQANAPETGPPTLRTNTTLQPIAQAFNYPFWLAGIALLLGLAAGGAALFRRPLRRRYRAYRLRKNHVYFLAQFTRHAERFTLSRSVNAVERAVTLWKNYLATLEDNNLSSLTSKELVDYFENDADVRRALRVTDRVVYGNVVSEEAAEVDRAFQLLRGFAERRFAAVG